MIEKWKLMPLNTGVTHTRPSHIPGLATRVSVSKVGPAGNFAASGELVTEFTELFLRQPVPPEKDVVFNKRDLEHWADRVLSVLR